MLFFSKIRYCNFLSYGNYWTELNLNSHRTTFISGTNGEGKTTSLDAIIFALFGKPYRKINKPSLINSVNEKGLLTEIEFYETSSSTSTHYLVRRGMKPSVFEIFVNGEKMDERDNVRDQQKYLEENILKTNYRTFVQIVVLGSTNYIPFMHLNPAQRREFIENLLDIDIFSTMNSVLKERNAILRELKQKTIDRKESLDKLIERQTKMVEKLREQKQQEQFSIKGDIEELQSRLAQKNDEIEKLQSRLEELSAEHEELKEPQIENWKSELESSIHHISAEIKQTSKNAQFMQTHTECPTCKQHISEDHRQQHIQEFEREKAKNEKAKKELSESLQNVEKKLKKLRDISSEYSSILTQMKSEEKSKESIQKDIERLKKRKSEVNSDDLQNEEIQLRKYEEDIQQQKDRMEFLREKEDLYSTAFELLRDSGIKSRIISQYIPIINKLINQYLTELDFSVTFTLDETFTEQILSRHRDSFTYDNFSQGEKMRIDIALLMVWRNIAEMKNSIHTNLLLMDEVFDSSLDAEGVDDFLKIMEGVSKNNNIFVISHKLDMMDKFDRVLTAKKHGDFSYLETREVVYE